VKLLPGNGELAEFIGDRMRNKRQINKFSELRQSFGEKKTYEHSTASSLH